jgi:peptidoglycan-associated lipoprotein
MSWSRTFSWCVSSTALLLVVGACGPKDAPSLPAETMTESSPSKPADKPATDVKDAANPNINDKTPNPLDAELQTADKHARDTGLIGDIYFDFDKYDLKPEARERLSKNADFMKQNPKFVVEIQGHCDERGTNDYNIALADRRANAAREYLLTLGVADARLKTVSFGEERPVCTDHNESCWWRNRRGEFHLSGRS